MSRDVQTRLREIARYRSRYELVATSADGTRYRAGYTARPNRKGLLDLVYSRGERWEAVAGPEAEVKLAPKGAAGQVFGKGGAFSLTFGRTEREAIISGELPNIFTK